MDEFESIGQTWYPLEIFGLKNAFFSLGSEELSMIVRTWIILGILLIICLPVHWLLKKKDGVPRYLILSSVNMFIGLCKQAMGVLIFSHFAFIFSLFTFILMCNIIPIIPWMEEPTQNLNTTLALGIISFLYVQFYGIRAHGIRGYLKEYTEPFFVMAPLHVIGKLASIVSMSFRLFGNIFGGAIISGLYLKLVESHVLLEIAGLGLGINFVILFFFGLFEGFLQAFVFTMLSLTYLSIAIAHEEPNHGAST